MDTIKLKHILLQHQVKVVQAAHEDFQPIHVRRSSIFEDTVKAFSKQSFNASKMFKVQFIGESAEDEGVPRWEEYFQQLAFQSQAMFSGWPCHTIPVHNISSIAGIIIGVMIAIQGGQALACFSPAVADYLTTLCKLMSSQNPALTTSPMVMSERGSEYMYIQYKV